MDKVTMIDLGIPALDLFKQLQDKYSVAVAYTVGFNLELSDDVKEIIKHLKGDLYAEDIVPNGPTKLSIVLKSKDDKQILAAFTEDSGIYMEAFDKTAFREFAVKNLDPHTVNLN